MQMRADCEPIEGEAAVVEVIHQIPGRVRVRVPALRKDRRTAFFLQRELLESPGIRQVVVSPATAKVLVLFAAGRSAAGVAGLIREILAAGTPDHLAEIAPTGGQRLLREEKTLLPWHTMGGGDVLQHFGSSAGSGLSSALVEERRSFYGGNRLPGTASRSLPAIWKAQLTCLPVVLTGVAAFLSVLAGGMAEGALALMIALLNAAIGTFSENRSERILDKVRESVDLRARVVRDGRLEVVSFDDVMPGDVLDLQPGARIPADARLVHSD
jgi:Ca2+-transporting ATPase